jgi:NADH:ubiquinone oxidoreductase subunit 2 (subunit N)
MNLVRLMYFSQAEAAGPLRPAPSLALAIGACAAATVGLGLFPGPLLERLAAGATISLL